MVGSVAMKAYSTSQYLVYVRFPLYLITSYSHAFIDSIKLLIVSIRIEYIVFTALCLNCSKDSFVMFCDTAFFFFLIFFLFFRHKYNNYNTSKTKKNI